MQAPILVLPGDCTDPFSTVLVLDLGNFRMAYGRGDNSGDGDAVVGNNKQIDVGMGNMVVQSSRSVDDWFRERSVVNNSNSSSGSGSNKEKGRGEEEIASVDRCSFRMDHMSFVIGKVGNRDWDRSKLGVELSTLVSNANNKDEPSSTSSESIIEPITLSLDFGIENSDGKVRPPIDDINDESGDGDVRGRRRRSVARTCMFGVLPSISLLVTYSQISRVASVTSTWTSFLKDMKDDGNDILPVEAGIEILEEGGEMSPPPPNSLVHHPVSSSTTKSGVMAPLSYNNDNNGTVTGGIADEQAHFCIELQRLSMKIANNDGDSVEAHLISAVASTTWRTDLSTSTRVRMGYFWILDGLVASDPTLPRRQRLVAHSILPRPAASFAEEEDGYDMIMKGFDNNDDGTWNNDGEKNCSSLADVTITKSIIPSRGFRDGLSPSTAIPNAPGGTTLTIIDATFSTLFVQW